MIKLLLTGLVLCAIAVPSFSDNSENNNKNKMTVEIEHLLEFIEDSNCTFIRNGKEHNAEDGLDHIEKKYAHFKKKIKTAEDFISRSATGSLISGKPYFVSCPDSNKKIKSSGWLYKELEKFRKNS